MSLLADSINCMFCECISDGVLVDINWWVVYYCERWHSLAQSWHSLQWCEMWQKYYCINRRHSTSAHWQTLLKYYIAPYNYCNESYLVATDKVFHRCDAAMHVQNLRLQTESALFVFWSFFVNYMICFRFIHSQLIFSFLMHQCSKYVLQRLHIIRSDIA